MNWSELVAPDIGGLTPYKAGMTSAQLKRDFSLDEVYKFNSNESPITPSPKVLEAIANSGVNGHLYPDYFELSSALSEHLGVQPSQLMLGNGSIDVVELACRLVAQENKTLLCSKYGYSAYSLLAAACGLKINQVASDDDFGHDVEVLINSCDENTAVMVIDSPTNMAGKSLDLNKLHKLLDSAPSRTLVILDQAYIEFTSGDLAQKSIQLIHQYPNLLITRTFSKAYGLAGLRVGYGIANEALISWLSRIQRPFPVSGVGVAAALAALSDKPYFDEIQQQVVTGREQLQSGISELGLKCIEGEGNFVLVHVGAERSSLTKDLMYKGFIVRPMTAFNMPDYLRISVSKQSDNKKLIEVLKTLI